LSNLSKIVSLIIIPWRVLSISTLQNCQICRKLSNLSRIVKFVKNCQSHHYSLHSPFHLNSPDSKMSLNPNSNSHHFDFKISMKMIPLIFIFNSQCKILFPAKRALLVACDGGDDCGLLEQDPGGGRPCHHLQRSQGLWLVCISLPPPSRTSRSSGIAGLRTTHQ